MFDKFRCEDLMKYYSVTRMEEVELEGIRVLHQYQMRGKGWIEFFVFDSDDIVGLDDAALLELVKTSPRVKTEPSIDATIGKYRFVHFNRLWFRENLHLFDKTLLQATRGSRIQRFCEFGKYNGNPKLYKRVWWVFHEASPCDNAAQLLDSDICRFASEEKMRAFLKTYTKDDPERPYYLLCKGYYRLGVPAFDYKKIREKEPDVIFAPPLEEDEEV